MKPSELLREMRRLRNAPLSDDPMLQEVRLQRLPPLPLPLLSSSRKHLQEQTAKIANDIILRYSLGVSALNSFSSPRSRIHKFAVRFNSYFARSRRIATAGNGRRDRFSPRRGGRSSLSPNRLFLPVTVGVINASVAYKKT